MRALREFLAWIHHMRLLRQYRHVQNAHRGKFARVGKQTWARVVEPPKTDSRSWKLEGENKIIFVLESSRIFEIDDASPFGYPEH